MITLILDFIKPIEAMKLKIRRKRQDFYQLNNPGTDWRRCPAQHSVQARSAGTRYWTKSAPRFMAAKPP